MQIFKVSDKIMIKKSGICSGKGVFAKDDINKGEIIIEAKGEISKGPTPYTVQITESEYLFADYIDNFINHSCSPNVYMKLYEDDKKLYSFLALKDIKKGQELFWNYNTNYWDVYGILDFPCNCGSENCAKVVKGAKYLTKSQQEKLSSFLTPFPRKKLLDSRHL